MKLIQVCWVVTVFFVLMGLNSCNHMGRRLQPVRASIQADSTSGNQLTSMDGDPTGIGSPGALFLGFIGVAFMLFCIGFGLAVTIVAMVLVFGLISLGIVSASVLVGVNQRSVSKGFKTFFILAFSTVFLFIGAASGWVLNFFVDWWTITTALIYGSVSGLVAGIFVGLAAYYVVRGMVGMYTRKLAGKVGNAKRPKV